MTYRIDEEALSIVESYGYSRKMIIDRINKREINHAAAQYYLLVHSTAQLEIAESIIDSSQKQLVEKNKEDFETF